MTEMEVYLIFFADEMYTMWAAFLAYDLLFTQTLDCLIVFDVL